MTSVTPVSTVERAFLVLQTVVSAGEPIGARELARRTGLPRSTVARLLATLTDLALVVRTAEGEAGPGPALASFRPPKTGRAAAERLRPLLRELVATFDERAAISVDDGDALRYIADLRATHPVSVPDVTNERHAFHLVAPGLVTMSHWSGDQRRRYLASPLAAATPHSMTDPEALAERIDRIGSQGFAWTDQELDVGVNGFAVPVLDADHLLVATISLFGPAYRFSPSTRPDLASEVGALVSDRKRALLGG